MPTSVSLGYCLWLAGQTWNDSIGRNQDVAAENFLAGTRGGVVYNTSTPLTAAVTTGLSFTVAAGAGIVPSSVGDGAYQVQNPTLQTLTCNAADPTNPRLDLVCLQVTDNGNNTSFAQIEIVAGTPSGSPVLPAVPTNGLALWQVRVNANATTLTQANLTDLRVYTAAPGGVIVTPSLSGLPTGYPGLIGYYPTGNYFYMLTASGVAPMRVLTSPAFFTELGSPFTLTTANVEYTLATVNFTALGGVDYLFIGRIPQIVCGSGPNNYAINLYIDSTKIQSNLLIGSAVFSGNYYSPATDVTHITNASKGTTPSAGAHTLKMTATNQAFNGAIIQASSTSYIELSVQQASL